MLTHDEIRSAVEKTAELHPIKSVFYFGSYADGRVTTKSDLDILVEFDTPRVSLLVISGVKVELEDILKIPVDVICLPLPEDSFLEIDKAVHVYGKT